MSNGTATATHYLTRYQVAERYDVHPKTVGRWIADHRIPFIRHDGQRTVYFVSEWLDRWDYGFRLEMVRSGETGVTVRPRVDP